MLRTFRFSGGEILMKSIPMFVLMIITTLLFLPTCQADPSIIVADYELTPSVFMPGDDGVLVLTIQNAETTSTSSRTTTSGSTTTVTTDTVGATIDNIWILPGLDGSKEIGATANYEDVGYMAPGSSFPVSFKLIANSYMTEGLYFPTVRISVSGGEDVSYPIPVKVSNATVNLLFTSFPSKISKSGSTLITLTAVNQRENTVDGVMIVPESSDGLEFTPNSVYIGSLDADASSTASFSINLNATGEKNLTFHVHFKNGDNEHIASYNTSIETIDTLDVGSVFTSIPRSIQKGGSSRITLEVYNAKIESITGVIVTPLSNTTVLPSQYFIGAMEPDDVFSASFDIYTDALDYGNHTIGFEVSFKQGSEYYKTPTISTSFLVVEGEGSTFQSSSSTNEQSQGMPNFDILGICLPVVIVIALIIAVVFLFRWKKKRSDK